MLRLLVGARFQALFHSPPGVLFTFPSRYWSTVGHGVVLSLGGWSPLLPAGFHVPGGTLGRDLEAPAFAYGALTLFRPPSHARSAREVLCNSSPGVRPRDVAPATPGRQRAHARTRGPVWAGPLSLAATRGVSVDFPSSGYLDVSVPPVALPFGIAGPRLLGSPIRAPLDRSPSAAPQGLSRLPAPFVGSPCQGIRRAPLAPSPLRGRRRALCVPDTFLE